MTDESLISRSKEDLLTAFNCLPSRSKKGTGSNHFVIEKTSDDIPCMFIVYFERYNTDDDVNVFFFIRTRNLKLISARNQLFRYSRVPLTFWHVCRKF